MAKITRKKLARGTKMVVEDVFPPLKKAADDINSVSVDKEQMAASWAPFRINLSVPYIASDLRAAGFHVPFALPPLQDSMAFETTSIAYADPTGSTHTLHETSPVNNLLTPKIYLTEVSFSFDQRDAPAAIASQYYADTGGLSVSEGMLSYDNITAYNIKLAITEKEPLFFVPIEQRTADDEKPRREVWSVNMPHENFANDVFALNPFVVGDINELIDPYKTYVFSIYAPGVTGASDRTDDTAAVALVSVEASLKFKSEVMTKAPIGAPGIHNAPTRRYTSVHRSATPNAVSVTSPTPGDKITADGASGVNTAIAAVDTAVRSKLYGGFNKYSEGSPTVEAISNELSADSAYEVIAIPLFQNSSLGGVSTDTAFTILPYSAPASGRGEAILIDRRVIPIVQPIVVEHVLVALNWQPFVGAAKNATESGLYVPNVSTWTYEFGVGIGTGLRADDMDYSTVATGSFTPGATGATAAVDLIDKIRAGDTGSLPLAGSGLAGERNLELRCVPLITTTGDTGPAYRYKADGTVESQAPPCFVGKAWSPSQSRTAPKPDVLGKEQWIEVRGRIRDTATAWAGASRIIVGYQGIFVYIIGRKFLA